MKEPLAPNEIPPGGWRVIIDKHRISSNTFGGLMAKTREYLRVNGMEIPKDLEQWVLDNLDKLIQEEHGPVEWLRSTEAPTFSERMTRFAHASKDWARSGFKVVSPEDYEFRMQMCQSCYYWRGEAAFGFGNCGKCGCTGIKLYWASEKCPLNPPRWGRV